MHKFNKYLISYFVLTISLSFQLLANDSYSSQSRGISIPASLSSITNKKQALIVGVSDYAGESADLNGIEKDVDKMRQLFVKWGFDVTVLFDSESMNILEYLTKYSKSLNSNDSFAFYYTGHGSHKKDENADESDGEDETLVLSDGNINKHLIDDILYQKFNNIKAKKLIFFDSCHSGTVFRSLTGKTQPKTIKPEDVTESFVMSSSKGMKIVDSMSSSNGEYIVFSSSQDTEESLATPTGSLFTNSLSEVFSDSNLANKPLNSVNNILVTKVVNYAKETDGEPHHPKISFSNPSIGAKSLQDFVSPKLILDTPVQPTIQENTSSVSTAKNKESLQSTLDLFISSNQLKSLSLKYDKSTYNTGELVKFKIDTLGEKGYLNIFYVDSNEVTVLYPNPYVSVKELRGTYTFPNDLSGGKFDIEAYKACNGCSEEKTTIYVLLSPEPIGDLKSISSSELLSFKKESKASKDLSRAVRVKVKLKSKGSSHSMLNRYQFIVK
jgi:hypothetical protein